MRDARGTIPGIVATLLLGASISAPILLWDAGIIETETTYFIQQYLDQRSVARKVFDPHLNDLESYQARELSYFIDLVDAYVFLSVLTSGHLLLIPLSTAIAAVCTVAVVFWGTRRVTRHLGPTTTILILLVYTTNFVYVATAGVFYRSAKPLLAPTLLTTLFFVYGAALRRVSMRRLVTPSSLYVLALGCVLSLLDRQGFFYLTVITGSLLVLCWFRWQCVDLLIGALLATALMVLYNVVIGPWIIHEVNGYWPTFGYQQPPIERLLTEPRAIASQSTELFVHSARVLFGSFPHSIYVASAVVLFILSARWLLQLRSSSQRHGEAKQFLIPALLIGLAIASQVIMLAVMILRHRPVYDWPDHRLWYYPLPLQATLLFALVLLVDRLLAVSTRRAFAVNVILALMIVSNIASWRKHRETMLQAPWFGERYFQTVALKRSLRSRSAAPELDASFLAFYEYCARRLPSDQRAKQ